MGSEWVAQNSGGTYELRSVSAVNANIAWAVGYNGTILYTLNAGATWTAQASGTDGNLFGVSAVNANIAWAVGYKGAVGDSIPLILKTIDGGTTWIQQNTNIRQFLGGVVSCASDSDGSYLIVVSSRIYVSSDYGATWGETRPGGNYNRYWACCAIDDDGSNLIVSYGNRVYVYRNLWWNSTPSLSNNNYCCASDSDGSNLIVGGEKLFLSSDFGVTWVERQPAGNYNRYWGCCASDSDGSHLIVGDYGGRLYTSSDYGVTWTQRTPYGYIWKFWYGCASDSDGSHLIVCDYGGRVFTSSDYGVTWVERRPAGDYNKNWKYCASDSDGSNLIVSGDRSGDTYSVGIYTSSDFGVTWVERQADGVDDWWGCCASDSDGSRLIAANWDQSYTFSKLYTSSDGGANWVENLGPYLIGKLRGVYAIDANTAWAVGYHAVFPGIYSLIAKTTDGGDTWENILTNYEETLYSVSAVDANVVWVSDNSTFVLCSIDGGITWGLKRSGDYWGPTGIVALDTNKIWVVGSNPEGGFINYTVNGGTNWDERIVGLELYNISAMDANKLWAVGYRGNIVCTLDGGNSWVVQISGTTRNLFGTSAVNEGTVWAVGAYGTILKYMLVKGKVLGILKEGIMVGMLGN